MDADTGPKLKPGGKIVIFLIVLALLFFAGRHFKDSLFPETKPPDVIDPNVMKGGGSSGGSSGGGTATSANPPPTTVTDVTYVGKTDIKDMPASSYKFENNTVVFPINVWAGWSPIVAANGGFKPSENSLFFKKFGFKVDIKVIDSPDDARNAYASGSAHILWGTLDMISLVAPSLAKDPRVMPRVCQQIDFSNGGDGIVVRQGIRTARDLKGKTIVLAQNSPSHFFILNILVDSGLQPRDVTFKFTGDAFQAASAFYQSTNIDACVSWSPDIYNIVDPANGGKPNGVKGAHLLTTTKDASNLIADVWAVRSDFQRDHPDIVKGLVQGIFEGMDLVKKDPDNVAKLMSEGYKIPVDDCKAMLGDAHLTNFAENKKFFMDADNPAGFDRLWDSAAYVYMQVNAINIKVRSDLVKDTSVLAALDKAGTFAGQKEEYLPAFHFDPGAVKAESTPILTKTLSIKFDTNKATLDPNYDKTIPQSVEEIGQLAGKFGACLILIEGNCDQSMKGVYANEPKRQRELALGVQRLSEARAEAVKQALIDKFKFDPNKFYVKGNGWDSPIVANPATEIDFATNRRTEIKVLPLEAK